MWSLQRQVKANSRRKTHFNLALLGILKVLVWFHYVAVKCLRGAESDHSRYVETFLKWVILILNLPHWVCRKTWRYRKLLRPVGLFCKDNSPFRAKSLSCLTPNTVYNPKFAFPHLVLYKNRHTCLCKLLSVYIAADAIRTYCCCSSTCRVPETSHFNSILCVTTIWLHKAGISFTAEVNCT